MTTNEQKLLEQNFRRREFPHETPDPIKDAVIIHRKVQGSSCLRIFGAAVAIVAAVFGMAVWL